MHPDSPATWYNCSQQGAKGSSRRRQETEGKKATFCDKSINTPFKLIVDCIYLQGYLPFDLKAGEYNTHLKLVKLEGQ